MKMEFHYIIRAFEIANQYAPNIKYVYNQHSGMEEVMWEKVLNTIIYLKNKGLRSMVLDGRHI